MILTRILLLLVALHTAWSQYAVRPNWTLWPDDTWVSGDKAYEEVSLVQSKFKSKEVAGLAWYEEPAPESGAAKRRHLEWLDGSDTDSESAGTSDKGFFSDWFGDDDDEENRKEPKIDPDLRQHHRKKYVKVNKMLLPLLLAYKLKFFTMVPLLIGALVLLVTTTGLAGFFFALFGAATGLHVKNGPPH